MSKTHAAMPFFGALDFEGNSKPCAGLVGSIGRRAAGLLGQSNHVLQHAYPSVTFLRGHSVTKSLNRYHISESQLRGLGV